MRAFLILLIASGAFAEESLDVDPAASTIAYHLVHKLHEIRATSNRVEGRAMLVDGRAQVVVRVPVESFDSGNVNRDEHMKEAAEAARYPTIELKALADGILAPARFPTTMNKSFKAQLSFHGVKQLFELPIELTWESPTRVKAQTRFEVSLEAYHVERPSLMFVKVNDALGIEATVLFKRP